MDKKLIKLICIIVTCISLVAVSGCTNKKSTTNPQSNTNVDKKIVAQNKIEENVSQGSQQNTKKDDTLDQSSKKESSKQTNTLQNKSSKESNKTNDTLNPSPNPTKKVTKSDSNKKDINRKTYFGTWVIDTIIAPAKVTAYTDAEAKAIIGTKLYYSSSIVKYNNQTYKNPLYKENTLNKDEFFNGNKGYVSFEKLGIKGSSVKEISLENEDNKNFFDFPGDYIIVVNNNKLITCSGGIYFSLKRIK